MPRRRKDAPPPSLPAPPPARFRDRVQDLRRVRAGDLVPHPKNWRVHGDGQRAAMTAALDEIGIADTCVVRPLPDGRMQVLDGHLRADLDPETLLPCTVVDLDDTEAEKFVGSHDALTLMAGTDGEQLRELANTIDDELLRAALLEISDRPVPAAEAATDVEIDEGDEDLDEAALAEDLADEPAADEESPEWGEQPEEAPPEYSVVVVCKDEAEQRAVFEKLSAEGRECRLLTL